MKTYLKSILFATCAVTGTAAADHTSAGPDFQQTRARHVERAHAASDAETALHPVDVIAFRFDSSRLDRIDRIQIRAAARWLKANPEYRLVVEGHTDAIGGDVYNAGLAARRAEAVRDALVKHGVRRDRVIAAIYGEGKLRSKNLAAQANRVVVMYATKLTPTQIVRRTLPLGIAVVWS